MVMPAQVRKQTEAVKALYDQLNQPGEGQESETTTETLTEGDEASVESQADSDAGQAPKSDPAEHRGTDTTTEETFAQKYKTLQGMYNAEVPRLHSQNRELTNRVKQLEQLLASMTAQPAADQQPQTQPTKLVTDQEIEEYGESLEVMRKVSREEAAAYKAEIDQLKQLVRSLQANVVPRVEQMASRQAASAEQAFWAELQANVPDWRDINADHGFQSWLLEVDPLTGVTRQTYLDDAQRNLDVRRVANFFTTWRGQTGQPVARTDRQATAASQLEKQVAPGRGRSGGSQASGNPKTYTSSDIKAFFADVQKGRYKGREQERDRIERDIFAAQREGRIVND